MVPTGMSGYSAGGFLLGNCLLRQARQGIELPQDPNNGSTAAVFSHKSRGDPGYPGFYAEPFICKGFLQEG